MDRKEKKKRADAGLSGSAGRLIVTYVDGTWTDNLAVARYRVQASAAELVVSIEVAPRERPGKVLLARRALRDFVANLDSVHTLQVGKRVLGDRLRGQVRALEHSCVGVRLSADGHDKAYPAALVIGPDEITLNLG